MTRESGAGGAGCAQEHRRARSGMEDGSREAKRALRREILARRDALTAEERERARILIAERILGHQWYYRAERILAFAPFGSEIDIREILEETLRQGKELYLPRIEEREALPGRMSGEDGGQEATPLREMHFRLVSELGGLCPGFHGILEPPGSAPLYCYDEAEALARPLRDLMILPGVAFDPLRNRLGYGGGYYDRFLADKETLRIHTIAVCHACQIVQSVPAGELDVRPYQVICVP